MTKKVQQSMHYMEINKCEFVHLNVFERQKHSKDTVIHSSMHSSNT